MKKNGCVNRTLSLLIAFVVCFSVITLSFPITSKAASDFQIIKAIKTYKSSFDSGIVLSDNYSVEMCFSLDGLDQYSNVFEMGNTIALRNESSRGLYARYGWYNGALYKPLNQGMNIVKLQGNVFTINNSAVLKPSKQNLNYNTTLKFGAFNGQISYVTIKNANQVPVADFYAATDADGKAGMYDAVSGKFIYSSKDCSAVAGENEYFKGNVNSLNDSETDKNKNNEQNVTKDSAENSDADNEKAQEDNSSITEAEDSDRQLTTALKAIVINNGSFDTGIMINQDNSYEMVFEMSNTAVYRDIVTSSPYILRLESSRGLYVRHGWANEPVYKIKQDTAIDYLQKKNEVYVNDAKVMKFTKQTITGAKKLTFGSFQGKIELFKVYDSSNKVIAEFVPVLDANGVACMEDTVSGNLIYCSKDCEPIYGQRQIRTSSVSKDTSEAPQQTSEKEKNSTTAPAPSTTVPAPSTTAPAPISQPAPVSQPAPASTSPSVTTNPTYDAVEYSKRKEIFRAELINMVESADKTAHDLTRYGLTPKEVMEIFKDVISNEEKIAYNSIFNLNYQDEAENGIVKKFWLVMIDDGYLDRYAKMKQIVQNVKNTTQGMNDLQKVVYIHDYVCDKTTYSLANNQANIAAGALVNGKAVCAGYSKAMALLLQECGVESDTVIVGNMNHMWTKVKVDGKWYFADPTWDDTIEDSEKEISHKYLLRNDKEFRTFGYYGWDGTVSTSTIYSNWKIHDVIGKISYSNNGWTYTDVKTNEVVKLTF